MTNQELWQSALGEIELNISKANFVTWFRHTAILDKKDSQVVLGVPSGFAKEWLQNKYCKLILKALRNISPEIKEVDYIIQANLNSVIQKTNQEVVKAPTKKTQSTTPSQNQSTFQEFEIDQETNLNPRYTFDSFIVGSHNELAYAAAQAVANNLGSLYNPLFIYGLVGLGKTHLIQSIGNEIVKKNKNRKVKYVSSDKFTAELIDSLHKGKIEQFKELYQKIDLLIIDDIQFLSGKEKTQEEFFHTFNALYQKNKQIIISSDRPPKAIATLEERLRSRFEGGMIADISYPDLETRMAILKSKISQQSTEIKIDNDALVYIADNVSRNIRELEGALNKVLAFSRINNGVVSKDSVKKILGAIISAPKKNINYKTIISTVSEYYEITEGELINKCRRKDVVFPRQIVMFLMREELKNSFPFIGEKLGGRDHTTVMYACDKLNKEILINETLQQDINTIKDKLYSI